jgi:hypothetical protein
LSVSAIRVLDVDRDERVDRLRRLVRIGVDETELEHEAGPDLFDFDLLRERPDGVGLRFVGPSDRLGKGFKRGFDDRGAGQDRLLGLVVLLPH